MVALNVLLDGLQRGALASAEPVDGDVTISETGEWTDFLPVVLLFTLLVVADTATRENVAV